MFTLHNSKGSKVFLPTTSVLKIDDDPPNTNRTPDHPYTTRSKDKHNVTNDPEATMHLMQNYSKINVDEQKILYEQAQRASKQGGEGQQQIKSSMDANSGGMNNSQQHGGRYRQPQGYQQGSSVYPTGHGHHAGKNPFYSSQAPHHQNQQPYYHQGSDVGPTGYEQKIRQQQFYGSQVSQHQSEQPGYYQSPKVDLTGFGQNVARQKQQFYDSQVPQHQSQQLNYDLESIKSLPHCNPLTTQMAHIPRAEIRDDPSYFPATGMLHSYFKLYFCLVVCDFIECLIHCDNSDMAL